MIFSIIIAAYNIADYVKQAIDSCLNQVGISQNDYEIIVIDDGSTDNTGSIIDEYSNSPLVHIIHQKNKGLSGTRNHGVELAKGDFILYLDGDDWLLPDTLSVLKPKTIKYDLIVFPMIYWYSEKDEFVNSYELEEDVNYTSKQFLKETLGKQKLHIIPAPCKIYRRSILIENNQKFIEGILHEDNPYFSDTAYNFNRITYIDKGLYVYRQKREGSITNSQTLNNFWGTVEGEKNILAVWGFKNKYMNYMNSCTKVFQVIMDYKNPAEVQVPICYYRKLSQKWIQLKQLLNYPWIPKAIVRHILLMIDPSILRAILKVYYKK